MIKSMGRFRDQAKPRNLSSSKFEENQAEFEIGFFPAFMRYISQYIRNYGMHKLYKIKLRESSFQCNRRFANPRSTVPGTAHTKIPSTLRRWVQYIQVLRPKIFIPTHPQIGSSSSLHIKFFSLYIYIYIIYTHTIQTIIKE